jgi:hypothetical protein
MESTNNSKSNTQQKNKKIAKSLFATAISNVKARLPNSEVLHNPVSKKRHLEDMNITTSGNILNVNNSGKRSHIENVGIEPQASSSTSKVAISCDPASNTNSKGNMIFLNLILFLDSSIIYCCHLKIQIVIISIQIVIFYFK